MRLVVPTFVRSAARSVLTLSLVLAVASARAENQPGLTDLQQAAKAEFDRDLEDSLQELRSRCKVTFTVTSDFENFSTDVWGEGGDGWKNGRGRMYRDHRTSVQCMKTVDAIISICQSNAAKEAWTPVIARELKGISCVFTGHQPRRPGDARDPYIKRNLSFSNGVLMLRNHPDLEDVGNNGALILMAGLAHSPGAPAVRKDILRTGENGAPCSRWSECATAVCQRGVCQFCGPKASCQKPSSSCHEGVCMTERERSELQAQLARNAARRQDERSSSPQCQPAGTPTGSPFSCCSKKLRVVKDRGFRRTYCQ